MRIIKIHNGGNYMHVQNYVPMVGLKLTPNL